MGKSKLAIALFALSFTVPGYSWTGGGAGGSASLGGQITLQPLPVQVWEAQVGTKVANLDITIPHNTQSLRIPVASNIPVLGMRPVNTGKTFTAPTGATNNAQINYNGKYNLASITNGVGTLTLDVKDSTSNTTIGVLTAKMTTAGVISAVHKTTPSSSINASIYAPDKNTSRVFSGGLATDAANAIQSATGALNFITSMFPDVSARFSAQSIAAGTAPAVSNANSTGNNTYSGAYGAGIVAGSEITINLNQPLTATTTWKATLPITISYA